MNCCGCNADEEDEGGFTDAEVRPLAGGSGAGGGYTKAGGSGGSSSTSSEPNSVSTQASNNEEALALVLGGSVLIKHGDMVKRPVVFRLSEVRAHPVPAIPSCITLFCSQNGEELLYSTRLSTELTAINAKQMPLDEIISITKEGAQTIAIRTFERVHKLDAKNEKIASLWTKAITGNLVSMLSSTSFLKSSTPDAMSIRLYMQNDVPQLKQGVVLAKQGTLMKRDVMFQLTDDGNAFDYGKS